MCNIEEMTSAHQTCLSLSNSNGVNPETWSTAGGALAVILGQVIPDVGILRPESGQDMGQLSPTKG
jgi:hypothetical protein